MQKTLNEQVVDMLPNDRIDLLPYDETNKVKMRNLINVVNKKYPDRLYVSRKYHPYKREYPSFMIIRVK